MASYEINEFSKTARIEYQYENAIITLDMDKEWENNSSKIDSMNRGKEDTISILSEDIEVSIKEIQDENDVLPSYTARWEREGVIYQFAGKMNKDIFCEIIKEIIY